MWYPSHGTVSVCFAVDSRGRWVFACAMIVMTVASPCARSDLCLLVLVPLCLCACVFVLACVCVPV